MGETQGIRPETAGRLSSSEGAASVPRTLARKSVAAFKLVRDREGNVTRHAEIDGNVLISETIEASRPKIMSVPETDPAISKDVLEETSTPSKQTEGPVNEQPAVVENKEPGLFTRTYRAAASSLSSLFSDIAGWAGNSTVANDVRGHKNDVELQ